MANVIPLPILLMIAALVLSGVAAIGVCKAESNPPEVLTGTELDFPPYAFTDKSGEPTGFSIELIKAVAGAMGVPLKISTGSWDTVWNDLVAGKLDVLPIVAKTAGRQRLVDFSLPHTETYDAFFVQQGDSPPKNIAAAEGMEIVAMRSDAAHQELLARNFQGNLILVDTIPEGLSLISSGKHNALLCSKLIGTLLIKKLGLGGLSAGPPIPDYKRVFSFAVKKGDTELLEKLNQGLLIVKTNGEYQRIYNKWLAVEEPWHKVKKYLLPTVVVMAVLILIAGIWLLALQRIITERKQAEKALREQKDFAETLLDTAQAIVLVLDKSGRIVRFNRFMEDLSGYKLEEVRGKDWFSTFLPKEDHDHIRELFKQAIGNIQTRSKVNPIIAKDGRETFIEWYDKTLRDSDGGVVGLLAIGLDITERKRSEEKINELARFPGENPNPVLRVSKDGYILYANDASRPFLKTWKSKIDQRLPDEWNQVIFDNFNSGTKKEIELKCDDRLFSLTIAPVVDDGYVNLYGLDITDRKKAEDAIRESENRFRTLAVLAPVGIYLSNTNGKCQYVNERWCEMAGMAPEEAWGDGWIKGLHPDDLDLVSTAWEKTVASEDKWAVEYRFRNPQGKTTFVLSLASPIRDEDGQITGFIGANQDITHLKHTEDELRVSLKEKDVLLAEIHHRVKNNMQIVAGLLNISSMQTSNQEAKDILEDARSRVFSMALIHSQLYQKERFDEIDIGTFAHRLAIQLSSAYEDGQRSVHTVVEPSDVYLTLNQAIPCGLVMNELITNALKHAFKERQKGTITVSARLIEDDMVMIKVKDDGVGIPEGKEIDKSKTMGYELLKGLVSQLGGIVQFKQNNGTEVTVKFKSIREEKQNA